VESAVDRDRHWISEEVGLILRVAGVAAQDHLLHAYQLVTRLPETVGALEDGVLHPVQARRLSEAVIGLTDEQCAQVQTRMLTKVAAAGSLSIAQFGRSLKRAVMVAAPKTAEQAHVDALAEARVEVRPLEYGMALLLAWLPAPDAFRVKAAIEARARVTGPAAVAGVDECRLIDARRAHALIELVELGASADPAVSPKRAGSAIQVTVGLQTLLGASDEPGELNGYGPIPASMARLIAADPGSTWRRLVTDPLGKLINYGRTRYEPPPELDEFIRARDRVCSFPNCHRRAVTCELDHIRPWAQGGETCADNLVTACARHHHLNHDGNRTNNRAPATGTTTWTSPTPGHTYPNPPPELPGAGS